MVISQRVTMTNQSNRRPKWLEDQDCLSASFRGPSGVVAEGLNELIAAEAEHGRALIAENPGVTTVLDCFQAFVVQSFGLTSTVPRIADTPPLCLFLATFRM